jgi:hypothetical protein
MVLYLIFTLLVANILHDNRCILPIEEGFTENYRKWSYALETAKWLDEAICLHNNQMKLLHRLIEKTHF